MRSSTSIVRALRAFAVVTGLAATTGCSMLSAVTNPKVGFAMGEPAPMSLVVRRAEVARATADAIDRLLARTPLDEASQWTSKTALTTEQATTLLNDVASEPAYAELQGAKFRVLAAEAWLKQLSPICPKEKKIPSLVAALGPEVQKRVAALADQHKELASLKADIAKEEAAIDAKDATEADKVAHKKAKKELEEKADKADQEIEPKMKELLASIVEEGGKADDPTRERLAGPVLALERATADAKAANGAALLRYPLALPTMVQELQSATKRILADVVEEKIGTRPDTNGLKPDVKLDGLEPKLTLNGIPTDKLGGLSPGDLLAETTKRLKAYVERVTLLTAYASETQDELDFDGKILEAMHKGLKLDPAKAKDAGDDLGDLKVETTPPGKDGKAPDAKGEPKADAKAPKGARTPGGLVVATCEAPAAAPPPADKDKAAKDKAGKDKDAGAKKQAKKPQGGKGK